MIKLINYKGKEYSSSKELYDYLEIKEKFSTWIKLSIKNTEIKEGENFVVCKQQSTGGRPLTDYLLTKNASLKIVLQSRVNKSMKLADLLIEVWEKKQKGQSFEIKEIHALIDLSKSMTLVSIQKEVEKRHFAIYNDKYTWYAYRAELLGYSTKDVIEAMRKVNKKHKSIRKSLVKLDANELIRTGIIDFFIALGKTKEYSVNAGNLCKKFASEMHLGNQIWDDTKENPLQINQSEVDKKKVYYENNKSLNK